MKIFERNPVRLLLIILPIPILASIWYPFVRHYHVGNIAVSEQQVEEAGRLPLDNVLAELAEYDVGLKPYEWENPAQTIHSAEKLIRGEVDIPGLPPARIRFPFSAEDLLVGSPSWQLQIAGMVPTMVLLDAYRASGRDAFLAGARDTIVAWDGFERNAWRPQGFLWNDHAIASRVYVLVDFWSQYRGRSERDPEAGKAVLRMAERCGRLLSKPGLFNYATNHGVMQNLALWHLSLSFRSLPGASGFRNLALARLREQMEFYISDEGVVLEHSAGYQGFGLELIGLMFRYHALSGMSIPPEWTDKYRKATNFYNALRRPDGSLPNYGDTGILSKIREPKIADIDSAGGGSRPPYRRARYPVPPAETTKPVSGYSVWWDGVDRDPTGKEAAQTVSVWSYFPGHGHKHSDEMSIVHWAAGTSWWGPTGYWPYGVPGREKAEGWEGSNAPHILDEPAGSARTMKIMHSYWSPDVALLDMVREGPGKYVVRRQLIRPVPGLSIVIDTSSGADGRQTVRYWTAPRDSRLQMGNSPGSFRVEVPGRFQGLKGWVLGSEGLSIRTFRGSFSPFAGWQVVDGIPVPVPALEIGQSGDGSYAAIVWISPGAGNSPFVGTGTPAMRRWGGAEDWELEIPVVAPSLRIERRENRLVVSRANGIVPAREIVLEPGPEVEAGRREILSAFAMTVAKYPKFQEFIIYRIRGSFFVLALFTLQEIFLRILVRRGSINVRVVQYLGVVGWIGVAGYIHFLYLAA